MLVLGMNELQQLSVSRRAAGPAQNREEMLLQGAQIVLQFSPAGKSGQVGPEGGMGLFLGLGGVDEGDGIGYFLGGLPPDIEYCEGRLLVGMG